MADPFLPFPKSSAFIQTAQEINPAKQTETPVQCRDGKPACGPIQFRPAALLVFRKLWTEQTHAIEAGSWQWGRINELPIRSIAGHRLTNIPRWIGQAVLAFKRVGVTRLRLNNNMHTGSIMVQGDDNRSYRRTSDNDSHRLGADVAAAANVADQPGAGDHQRTRAAVGDGAEGEVVVGAAGITDVRRGIKTPGRAALDCLVGSAGHGDARVGGTRNHEERGLTDIQHGGAGRPGTDGKEVGGEIASIPTHHLRTLRGRDPGNVFISAKAIRSE